jgi:hypothetical protein
LKIREVNFTWFHTAKISKLLSDIVMKISVLER